MRDLPSFWTFVLLSSLGATVTSAVSIDVRGVTPGSAGPVSPYSNNYTVLPSGVRIYGTPSLLSLEAAAAEDDDLVSRRGNGPSDTFSASSYDQSRDNRGRRDISSSHGSSNLRSVTARPRTAAGWCTASTIDDQGSDSSPLIADCQAIATQVYALAGSDNAYFGRSECSPDAATGQFTCYFPVVSYQTCMFGVSTVDAGLALSVRVGWQDVGDLITDSIAQCGNKPSSGRVGTAGEMTCPEEVSAVLMYSTAWGLYHA